MFSARTLKNKSSSCSVWKMIPQYLKKGSILNRSLFQCYPSVNVLPFTEWLFNQYDFSEDKIYQWYYLGKFHLIVLALRHVFFTTGKVPNLPRDIMEVSSSKVCKNQLDQSLLGDTADPALGGQGWHSRPFWFVLFCFCSTCSYWV